MQKYSTTVLQLKKVGRGELASSPATVAPLAKETERQTLVPLRGCAALLPVVVVFKYLLGRRDYPVLSQTLCRTPLVPGFQTDRLQQIISLNCVSGRFPRYDCISSKKLL